MNHQLTFLGGEYGEIKCQALWLNKVLRVRVQTFNFFWGEELVFDEFDCVYWIFFHKFLGIFYYVFWELFLILFEKVDDCLLFYFKK